MQPLIKKGHYDAGLALTKITVAHAMAPARCVHIRMILLTTTKSNPPEEEREDSYHT